MSERGDKLALILKGKDAAELNGTVRKLLDLVQKTSSEKPCAEDVKALERLLEKTPHLSFLVFDMADQVEEKALRERLPSKMERAAVKTRLKELRRELGYEEAPELERLLIEQVALCWLQHSYVEFKYTEATSQPLTWDQDKGWERKLAASQRRYLRACETLARIRKLTRSTVQVNIAAKGGQQVNVAGDLSVSREVEPEDVSVVAQELPEG